MRAGIQPDAQVNEVCGHTIFDSLICRREARGRRRISNPVALRDGRQLGIPFRCEFALEFYRDGCFLRRLPDDACCPQHAGRDEQSGTSKRANVVAGPGQLRFSIYC